MKSYYYGHQSILAETDQTDGRTRPIALPFPLNNNQHMQQPPFYGHYTSQPGLASTSSYELEDFAGAKFYCPHALAEGNQRVRIREKTLEFSSTALSTLSWYHLPPPPQSAR